MGISPECYDHYVISWRKRLAEKYRPHRQRWPGHLFHHAPLENILKILKSGNLLSRNDALNTSFRDVAGTGIIDRRNDAHNYGRLYFRPRTPTQYIVEGIQKLGDIRYSAHAPVLYVLVFDAKRILTEEETRCSDGNMQSWGTAHEPTEEFFRNLPFEKVYHEGGYAYGYTDEIKHRRCAEVLVKSPFSIRRSLKFIYCRSSAERETLLHELGPQMANWAAKVVISDDLNVFEKRFTFVQTVDISQNGISFELHPRFDGQTVDMRLCVYREQVKLVDDNYSKIAAVRLDGQSAWIKRRSMREGSYLVRIDVEGHLAYRNELTLGEMLF